MWLQLCNIALGIWLLVAPTVLPSTEAGARIDRVAGPVVIWVAVLALRDVTRPLRALNVLAGMALTIAPWRVPGTAALTTSTVVAGWTIIALSIVAPEHVDAVIDRVLQEDLFCGRGVRTLSAHERAYNPLDYQTGSVWPHDNALIALGARRWGYTQALDRIFTGIFQAATQFTEFRLPEVFDGFSWQQYPRPVHFPVACSPQAWAAGALPLLLQTALGLEPDALNQTPRIHRPHLPDWLSSVSIHGLRVANASVDVRYQRENGRTLVAVLGRTGSLEVVVQYQPVRLLAWANRARPSTRCVQQAITHDCHAPRLPCPTIAMPHDCHAPRLPCRAHIVL